MANSYLDKTGLGILWNKIKALIPQPTTTTSENPKVDGTAAIGSSAKYARADHVHPTDTSRVPTTRKVNGHALSGDVTVTASDIGVAAGAQVNVIESVKANGTALTVTDKAVNIPVATTGVAGLMSSSDKTKLNELRIKYLTRTGTSQSNRFVTVYHEELSGDQAGGTTNYDFGDNDKTWMPYLISYEGSSLYGKIPPRFLPISIDSNGIISQSNLPSYVDDVIEAYPRSGKTISDSDWLATGSATGTVITPETGKIYILMAKSGDYGANSQFRWGGSTYVEITNSTGVSAITETEINAICV